jgi:hypothetical protein
VTPAAVNKYQRRRAVAGPWALSGNHGRSFDGVVVIPALAEEQSLPETLNSLGSNPARWREKILVVVVVNNRCDAPQPWREQNGRTLTLLEEAGGSGFGLNLAWVDASSAGLELPGDEGVGLARKIGFDLALECLDWRGDPLCASLDADTLTDGNYFKALMAHFRNCTSAGAVVPFRHCRGATPELDDAITHPAARLSARTPFGTGPALARLQDGELEAVRFSTRESFQLLGAFLRAVERAVEEDVDEITARLAPLSPALADFLGECGLDGFWSKLYRQHRRPDARRRAFHQWFDALRTRRMISRICDHHGWWGTAETVIPSLLTHLGLPSSGNADNYLKVLRKYQKSEAGV